MHESLIATVDEMESVISQRNSAVRTAAVCGARLRATFPNPNVIYDSDPSNLLDTIEALRNYPRAAIENVSPYENDYGTIGVHFSFWTPISGVHHMISWSHCVETKLDAREIAKVIEGIHFIEAWKAGFYLNSKGRRGYFATVRDAPNDRWLMIGRSSAARDFSGMPFDPALRSALQRALGGDLYGKSRRPLLALGRKA